MIKKLLLIAITGLCLVSCEGISGGYGENYPIYNPYPSIYNPYPRPYFYGGYGIHYQYNNGHCVSPSHNTNHHHFNRH